MPEKRRRDGLMRLAEDKADWVVGFEDECWWSRVAQPTLHSFSEEGEPLRLVEQSIEKDDPDPKAIACYGLYMPELKEAWLRFVDGRPVSGITTRFLQWCCQKLEALGKKVLVFDLGQRQLAHKPRGSPLDRQEQPCSQKGREGRDEDHKLSVAQEESVAQRNRAQVDSRQTQGGRGRRSARRL
jgi:hypothetical protein